MAKEEIFSRLNMKDYNNELEKILARKNFQEGTKNLLLNMLYKIEIAYNDYNKVKVETNSKREMIQNIINTINKYCDEIEIVKPILDKQTILKNKEYLVLNEQKKIISYPNEFLILSALQQIENNKKINIDEKKYSIIKKSVEEMFNSGYEIDISEIIRDFDGWTWSGVKIGKTQNISYNLIYQCIKILLGNNFIEKLFNCFNENKDCIYIFQEELNNKYEEEFAKELYNLIYQNSMLEYLKHNKQEKTRIIKYNEMLKKEIAKMENKSEYLQTLANSKRNISKSIKKIDKMLNDNILLQEEFERIVLKIKKDEKNIDLNEYREMLKTEREKNIIELNLCNSIMNPINYVKMKESLKEKIQLITDMKLDTLEEETSYKFKIKLQKVVLQAIRENIKNADKKEGKEITNLIYQMRYYKLLPLTENKQIKDIEELKEDIYKTEKELIVKAFNLKMLRIFSEDIEDTLKIYSKILESKIIDLDDVNVEFIKEENKVNINIYDDDIIEFTIKYKENNEEMKEDIKRLKIKFNKKMKII